MDDNILLAKEDSGILTLTLNRPDIMNSLNFSLLHALRDRIKAVRFRNDVRVVIITGSGERAFCAGADLDVAGREKTRVTYYLDAEGTVELKLYTIDGRPVKTLLRESPRTAGLHQDIEWDGKNGRGEGPNDGGYYAGHKIGGYSLQERRIIQQGLAT